MDSSKNKIIYFFRYLWIAIFLALIVFIFSQSLVLGRKIDYQLDFTSDLSRNIFGWYPQSRVEFTNGHLLVLAEPLYLDVYLPAKFKTMTVKGSFDSQLTDVRLGLRQKDGSWDFQSITSGDFEVSFDLSQAQTKRNFLQLILALPELSSLGPVSVLENNWQIIFSR